MEPLAIVKYRGIEIMQNPLTGGWLFSVPQAGAYSSTLTRCKGMIDYEVKLGLIDGSTENDFDSRKKKGK